MFSQNEQIREKMLAFVDGVHFNNRVEVPPRRKKVSIYEVTNTPTIIGKFLLTMR